ncbi:hypothetical protein [Burkholderia ubonensis]|uniref:hypothetical protein n=1 Tax=Burkholderia ubonensis TaxID=101571 RepID=UPI000AE37C04|nr:hypothetical protein [Burkholderia ubonensis]
MALQQCASTLRGPYRQVQVIRGPKGGEGERFDRDDVRAPNGGFSGSQRVVGAGMLYQ